MMGNLRAITQSEQQELALRGCFADDWSRVKVSECFKTSQVAMCRFSGDVEIGANVQLYASSIANYVIEDGCSISSVSLLECRGESTFGNGVEVAALNECGGRAIKIYDAMSAQIAYAATLYRHRPKFIASVESMVDEYARSKSSSMGRVGASTTISCAGIIRNVNFGQGVVVEGVSTLQNGTILAGSYFGADVKAHDFIAVENSKVANAATIERCFVGENVIISNGFTAVDSLFFASSHFENGESASIFAGPFTVSHHKSSLLIAGMFSFFNAGSGSNQSNHLFKCGPVHQGVHLRGCKFGSSAYVMLPAINGAYTSVIGSHSAHHDTSEFPFSYLINKEGRSTLIPAANLSSYGYVRDVEKWVKRDKRVIRRDVLNLEEHNPYITSSLIDAVNRANILIEKNPEAESYVHNKVFIKASNLHRSLSTYNKAVASSLGAILSQGTASKVGEGRGKWLDIAGQYITKSEVESILDDVELGKIADLSSIDSRFRAFAADYNAYAYDWAVGILAALLGHAPSQEEVEGAISASLRTRAELREMAHRDMLKDSSGDMEISYGIDSDNGEDREADFKAVRSL